MDYGHAIAVARRLREMAESSRKYDNIHGDPEKLEAAAAKREAEINAASWRCPHCDVVEAEHGLKGKAPCGHYWSIYRIVEGDR